MSEGINLLPQEIQREHLRTERAVLLNATSVAVLVVLGAILLVVFSYRLYVLRQVRDLDGQIRVVSQQVQEHKEVEGRLRVVKEKLRRLQKVWADEQSQAQVMANLAEIVNGQILKLGYDNKQAHFYAQVEVASVSGAADLLGKLEEKGYTKVKLAQIDFEPEGGLFRLDLWFNFNPNQKANNG